MKQLAFLMLALCAGSVLAAAPHQHGVVKLDVAVDGNRLVLDLEVPLDSLVGFERAPKTDKERAVVRAAAQRFHDGEQLFAPTPAAQCTRVETTLSSSVLAPALLASASTAAPKAAAAPAAAKPGEEGHADMDATLVYLCGQPAALQGLEVKMFDVFPKIRQIDAQVASGRGQSGAKLTPQKRSLKW